MSYIGRNKSSKSAKKVFFAVIADEFPPNEKI
jgi:hypothetical protein